MKTTLLRLFRAGGLGILVVSASAATYEVAVHHPDADDRGPGTTERPWKTLRHATAQLRPGDWLLVRGGAYREQVVLGKSGTHTAPIRVENAPGETVVLTGADLLDEWTQPNPDRPVYTTPWSHRFNTYSPTMTHPGDEYHRVIGRCEQVIVNGYLLRQVLDEAQLAPGAFFVDVSDQRLLVWDQANRDIRRQHVEGAVRQEILRVEGDHVQIRGIRFRYAANSAQHGGVVLAGAHGLLEDCTLEYMNSSGASFRAEDLVVRRCVFRGNGQLGFGASRAHGLRFIDCLVEDNNTKDFDRGWEAGGNKLALCRDVVLEQSRFIRNRGHGIWFDIGNENCTVRNCLIAGNEDSGIFYEISYGLQARDNVIVGNGFAVTPGAWGAQAGVSLSSSPDGVIERNLILGNREGVDFREQERSTPTIEDRTGRPVWNHDHLIRNNLVAFNRDAQVWGWFDVDDQRHWPTTLQQQSAEASPEWSLEKLNLRMVNNVYYAAPGQGGFHWGTSWKRHERYNTLDAFQRALQLEQGSRVIRPEFVRIRARDFRLPAAQMSELSDAYPRGPVPGVLLGILPAAE